MVRLVAPFLLPKTTILLPNPRFSDSKRLRAEMQSFRSLDGTLYTFVKKKDKKKLYLWDFHLTRNKSMELLEFYRHYSTGKIKAYWGDLEIIGYLRNNPFEFSTIGAAHGSPGNEYVQATVEIEEI